jgi:hypothetical protein
MQIKTTLGFHLTPIRMAIIKKINNKCWRRCRGKRNPYTLSVWMQIHPSIMDISVDKNKNRIAMPLLSTYPKKCKSAYNTDTCTLIFIVALFTIAKLWNQPRCPSIENVIYIYICCIYMCLYTIFKYIFYILYTDTTEDY